METMESCRSATPGEVPTSYLADRGKGRGKTRSAPKGLHRCISALFPVPFHPPVYEWTAGELGNL